MKLTLYVDWYGVDDDDLIKQQKSIVELPNNDGYHLFEAWMHLSRCERVDYRIVDGVIEGLYDIIVEVMEERYGLNVTDYENGKYDIDDPTAEDENNMSAIVSLYLNKRYHES
jgi:hypothetical protein